MKSEHDGAEEQEIIQSWKQGEPASLIASRPPTSVLSIRVPTETLRELGIQARRAGKSAGTLAREIIEAAIAVEGPKTPPQIAKMFARWAEEFGREHPLCRRTSAASETKASSRQEDP